jgi:hypothetical protein
VKEEEQPKNRTVTLKSGAQVDAGTVSVCLIEFRSFVARHHDRFVALRDLVQGTGPTPSPEILQEFRDLRYLDPDGNLKDDVKQIFLASYRETPDGPCFVDPYRPANVEEVQKLQEFEKGKAERMSELLKYLLRPRGDDTPSRG